MSAGREKSEIVCLVSRGPEDTRKLGRLLGESARGGEIYLLSGPLGAGKTCLTQGIARGLGVEGYVRSPTFVIAGRYTGRLTLHHLDLFRIDDPLEALDMGLDEYFTGQEVCVVEWADRAADLFPPQACWIEMDYGDGEMDRTIRVRQNGSDAAPEELRRALESLMPTSSSLEMTRTRPGTHDER